MIVPIVRSSPGSMAIIAWRMPRACMCARRCGLPNGGVSETTGESASTSPESSSAIARSAGSIDRRWSPGPWVVRSGSPSPVNSSTSATSALKASSERASSASSASASSGERESVRLAS